VTALDLGYDSTTTDLDRRHTAAVETRRVFENRWTLTIAYVLGHQWVGVDGSGRVFDVGNQFDDRVTITDNRMRPSTRTNVARLTKTDPMWIGIPKDRTDSEIQRARIRSDVYEHYWRELEAARRLRLAMWYRETTGNGFWKVVWDSTAGDAARYVGVKGQGILTDEHGRPVGPDRIQQVLAQLTPAQQAEVVPMLEDRDVTFGEPKLTLKTPFEIGVDPLATDEGLDTAEYITEEALYSPAYLKRHFPEHRRARAHRGRHPLGRDARGPLPGHEPDAQPQPREPRRRRPPRREGTRILVAARCRRPERQARGLDRPRPPAAGGGQPVPVPAVYAFRGLGGRAVLGGRPAA
jgi:hypothetical protein